MGYGGYLDYGLSAIAGERYAADDLKVPIPTPLTQTSHGGTIRALYSNPRMPTKIYGEIPVEEIEGHQVDPFYDVRGGGLGQVPTMTRGKRVGREPGPGPGPRRERRMDASVFRTAATSATRGMQAPALNEAIAPAASELEAGAPFGIPTQYLVYAGLALIAFRMFKK